MPRPPQRPRPARQPRAGSSTGRPGTHTPAAASACAVTGEDLGRRAVGDHPPSAPSTMTRVHEVGSHTADAVLDHDERRPGRVERALDCSRAPRATPSGSRFAVGSSSSTSPGRIASTPASASRCFCPPESDFVGRSSGTSRPTASSASATRGQISSRRHAEVLAAEGDVVAHLRQHHAGVGVLQHEPGAAAVRLRAGTPSMRSDPGLVALVGAAEDAGQAVQQRRLAGARGAEEQHALPRLDAERDVADRPACPPSGVAPAPAPAAVEAGAGRLAPIVRPAARFAS